MNQPHMIPRSDRLPSSLSASAQRSSRDMVLFFTNYLTFRALRGRRDELHLPLRRDEANRLAELELQFGHHEPQKADRPSFLLRLDERARLRLPLEFKSEAGDLVEGELGNISASGFFVATTTLRSVGERVTFKFLDVAAGRAWQFAGEVEWSREAKPGMGLRFVGIPLEMRLGSGDGPLPAVA